ncbi:uncharacterized protein LOC144706106 isoform X2 [Wolffia australiana]
MHKKLAIIKKFQTPSSTIRKFSCFNELDLITLSRWIVARNMEGATRRWLVDISSWNPSPDEFSFILSLFPSSEVSSVIRKRALASRLLQYALVQEIFGISFSEISIKRTMEGKPYLSICGQTRYPAFNFSVSHSGNLVGIASEPEFLVGLDIMSNADFKQQPTPDLLNCLSMHFTNFEWNNITKPGDFNLMSREFCRYWSLKEAYVKALGIGLGFKFNRLEFHHSSWNDISLHVDGVESKNWEFGQFDLVEKHTVSIARGGIGWNKQKNQSKEFSTSFNNQQFGFTFRKIYELIPAIFRRNYSNSFALGDQG